MQLPERPCSNQFHISSCGCYATVDSLKIAGEPVTSDLRRDSWKMSCDVEGFNCTGGTRHSTC